MALYIFLSDSYYSVRDFLTTSRASFISQSYFTWKLVSTMIWMLVSCSLLLAVWITEGRMFDGGVVGVFESRPNDRGVCHFWEPLLKVGDTNKVSFAASNNSFIYYMIVSLFPYICCAKVQQASRSLENFFTEQMFSIPKGRVKIDLAATPRR